MQQLQQMQQPPQQFQFPNGPNSMMHQGLPPPQQQQQQQQFPQVQFPSFQQPFQQAQQMPMMQQMPMQQQQMPMQQMPQQQFQQFPGASSNAIVHPGLPPPQQQQQQQNHSQPPGGAALAFDSPAGTAPLGGSIAMLAAAAESGRGDNGDTAGLDGAASAPPNKT